MHHTFTRYEIELDVLERNSALSDPEAIALLRSEFALALNAAHFAVLTAEDIAVTVRSRTVPQEGVARYALALDIVERRPDCDDAQAADVLRGEFLRALNASYFWRVCLDDFSVEVISRRPAYTLAVVRA